MTNGKFDSYAECQQYIATYIANNLPIPPDWYLQAASLASGGTITTTITTNPSSSVSSIPVSIYDYMKTKTPYSPALQACIQDTVQKLFYPIDKNEDTSVPGLLLGRIQSGKTRAFVGVMSLAFDKGIDACIVLTKPDDGLVQQTKARMNSEFQHFCNTSNLISSNVIQVYDVNKNITLTNTQLSYKNIFVLHKNKRLVYMKKLLDDNYVGKKVLVIDDEADFVSRTFYTKNQQTTGGVIGFRIDELTNNPQIDLYYLQVTATPYSLLLQPNDVIDVQNGTLSCFRPRFTVLVPSGTGYIGGKEYLEDSRNIKSMYSCLYINFTDDCFNYLLYKNKNAKVTGTPATHNVFGSLRTALMNYFVASSIRKLQKEKENIAYQTSMLVHCAIEKDDHSHQQTIIESILNFWETLIQSNQFGTLQSSFDLAYNDFCNSITLGINANELDKSVCIPSKADVKREVEKIFKNKECSITCVNGDNRYNPNLYTSNGQLKLTSPHNIFIGGFKADRGITIDNLIAFVYGRRPQSGGSANTILQHMRQYGYRSPEDMAVTRFYTTPELYQKLIAIYYTDEALRNVFKNNAQPSVVCISKDAKANYSLCSPNQVRMSDMYGYDSFGRIIANKGMQTNKQTYSYYKYISKELISRKPEQAKPFLVDKQDAIKWIEHTQQSFEYGNGQEQWDEEIMIAAIEKYCPADGKIWCYYRLDKNTSRMHNGIFSDAPEDGNTDTKTAKQYATDRPFLMFLGETGDIKNGWKGQPFFWPVLRLPANIEPSIYCYGVKDTPVRKKSTLQVTIVNQSVVISNTTISDTLIECIKRAGPTKVESLGINYRKNNLVYQAGRKPKDFDTIVCGKYYLRKSISIVDAKKFLEQISQNLHLNWKIEII